MTSEENMALGTAAEELPSKGVPKERLNSPRRPGILGAIGNTPLVYLQEVGRESIGTSGSATEQGNIRRGGDLLSRMMQLHGC